MRRASEHRRTGCFAAFPTIASMSIPRTPSSRCASWAMKMHHCQMPSTSSVCILGVSSMSSSVSSLVAALLVQPPTALLGCIGQLSVRQLTQQARVYQPCNPSPLRPGAGPSAPQLAPFDSARLATHNFINSTFFLNPHVPARLARTAEASVSQASSTSAKPAHTCRKCGHVKEAWPTQHGSNSGVRGKEASCALAEQTRKEGFDYNKLRPGEQKKLRGDCFHQCETCKKYLGHAPS